jgi:hypothetical protein
MRGPLSGGYPCRERGHRRLTRPHRTIRMSTRIDSRPRLPPAPAPSAPMFFPARPGASPAQGYPQRHHHHPRAPAQGPIPSEPSSYAGPMAGTGAYRLPKLPPVAPSVVAAEPVTTEVRPAEEEKANRHELAWDILKLTGMAIAIPILVVTSPVWVPLAILGWLGGM